MRRAVTAAELQISRVATVCTYSAPLRLSHEIRARGAGVNIQCRLPSSLAHRLEMTPALSSRLLACWSQSLKFLPPSLSHCQCPNAAQHRRAAASSWPTPPYWGPALRSPWWTGSFGSTISSGAYQEPPVNHLRCSAREGSSARPRQSCQQGVASQRESAGEGSAPRDPRCHSRPDDRAEARRRAPEGLGGRPPRRPPVCPISAITLAVPWSHPKHHQRCMDCSVSEMFVK